MAASFSPSSLPALAAFPVGSYVWNRAPGMSSALRCRVEGHHEEARLLVARTADLRWAGDRVMLNPAFCEAAE